MSAISAFPVGGSLTAIALAAALATGAAAQDDESTNRVAVETAWSVFVEDDPTECWAVSSPKQTVNTRDGSVVSVRRSDILLFVTFRPGSDVQGEVSFTGGYPFDSSQPVTMTIGDDSFELFAEGEWAWPESDEVDAQIAAAMRRGADATLVAQSSRGTRTEDTFSLFGFTAAVEEASKRCAGS